MAFNQASARQQADRNQGRADLGGLHVITGQAADLRTAAWPAVLLALTLLVAAIVAPLVLNTQMAQRAYDVRDQQLVLAELRAESLTLEAALLDLSSSEQLQKRAAQVGLVPAGKLGAINLKKGTVEGGVAAK